MIIQAWLFSLSLVFADSSGLQKLNSSIWPSRPLAPSVNQTLRSVIAWRSAQLFQYRQKLEKEECLQQIPAGKIILSETQEPFDGRVQGSEGLINLLKTKDFNSVEFFSLLIHETVHLTHQNDVPKDLYGLAALFQEGQAVYASKQAFPEFNIVRFLEWKKPPNRNELQVMCSADWNSHYFTKQLNSLFYPEKTELKNYPRLGYWIGYQMFNELAQSQPWCRVQFENFLMHSKYLLKKIKNSICGGPNV